MNIPFIKKHYLLLISLLLFSTQAFSALNMEKLAPNFTLKNSFGEDVSLSDYKGKTIVLEWTNHDCPFVKKHYQSNNMQGLQKKYTDKGVVWLSIISSAKGKQGYVTAEKANTLTKSRNAQPTHVLFDPEGKVGKKYGAKTTPHMYIINDKSLIAYNGAIDSIRSANVSDVPKADNYVAQALEEVLANKPVSLDKSRPYGCSVKYK